MAPLKFSSFESKETPAPAPRANGGLYTGEPCKQGAGWCAVPVVADAMLLRTTLASARPPPGATQQPWSQPRPGNNAYAPEYTEFKGLRCPK